MGIIGNVLTAPIRIDYDGVEGVEIFHTKNELNFKMPRMTKVEEFYPFLPFYSTQCFDVRFGLDELFLSIGKSTAYKSDNVH